MKNLVLSVVVGIFLLSSVSALCYEFDNRDYLPSHSYSKICSDYNANEGIVSFDCEGTQLTITPNEVSCSEDGCPGDKVNKHYDYYLDAGQNNFCGTCWDIDYNDGWYSWTYANICWDLYYGSSSDPQEPECVQNWDCTAWSDCQHYAGSDPLILEILDGETDFQYRSCTDLNGCPHENPPAMIKKCGSFSFDFFDWLWNWIKNLFSGTGSLDSKVSSSSQAGHGGGTY